ncbi:MAG: translocation/assembly module TamB domain-containing protein [Gammaproteobacteria bacterium]|nr:translocation/assembly module TamB domain-containing protein [Gammaproteobacteria bacterium]
MIGKLFKWLFWLILLTILIIGAAVGWLAGSNNGLQQALGLGQRFAPGELQWQQAEGRLFGPLKLTGLSYLQPDGLKVSFSDAELDWQPKQLLSRKLLLDKLHVTDLELHLPEPAPATPDADKEPLSLPDIRLPLKIEISDLDLGQIRIFPHGAEQPILLERLSLAAGAEDQTLQVLAFKLTSPEAEATLNGTINPVGNYPLDLALQWQYRHPEFGAFSGKGTVSGDLEALQIAHTVEGAVRLQVDSQVNTVLTQPVWDATVSAQSASLGTFAAELQNTPLDAVLKSRGSLDGFDIAADITTDLQQTGPLNLNIDANGNTEKLRIEEALLGLLSRPGKIRLQGDVDITNQALDIAGDWQSLAWPLIGAPALLETPAGTLHFKGSATAFETSVDARLQSEQFGRIDAQLNADGTDKLFTLNSATLKSPDSDIQLDASGEFDLQAQRFDAKGQWTSLAWPLQGQSVIDSPRGEFAAHGLFNDYRFNLSTDLKGDGIPAGNWQLDGQGDDTQLTGFELRGKLLDGSLTASGNAGWTPAVRWDVKLDGQQLNPAVQWPDLPGRLNLAVSSNGTIEDTGPALSADITDLSGVFRDQPLSGKGQVQVHGDELTVNKLQLVNGKTRLDANGRLGRQWNLDWNIASPDLSALMPDLSGSVQGKGRLTGTADAPRAAADLQIRRLALGENTIGQLDGTLDVDVSGNKTSNISLMGSGLQFSDQRWDKLTLAGKGKPADHQLSVDLQGPLATLHSALAGGLKGQTWQGQLTDLAATKTEFGDWKLKQPVAVSASAEQAELGDLCLQSHPSELCLNGNWNASRGAQGKLALSGLTAERFQDYLPSGMKIQTALNGSADGSLDSNGKLRANASFALQPGTLTVNAETDPVDISLRSGTLDAELNGDRLDSELAVDLADLGTIKAEGGLRNLSTTPALSGQLLTDLRDLTIISAFAPQLQEISGRLSSDLQIAGTLEGPTVQGTLGLEDFSAEVPQVAIKLEDTRLSAKSDGQGPLQLAGSSRSGGGTLSIDGQLDPRTRALTMKLTGDEYQLANSSQIQARITPDLAISMNDQGMQVDGKLVIPSAYINANGGNAGLETVGASSDVVIIEDEEAPEPAAPASNMTLDVRIELGDDVKVEAGDFRGALKGALQVEQTPELAPRGTGTIEVVNGDYVIYGQQLNMRRGKILFSGGPVDNPQLDMDVARNVEAYNVLAGAKILGNAQSPRLQLYSEPSMPDASILSYILLGQPPGTVGGSYTLGKYLTPDLYVGYGIGLFNAINTFNMRYKLTEKLAVHAASSNTNSADLIYTIEK